MLGTCRGFEERNGSNLYVAVWFSDIFKLIEGKIKEVDEGGVVVCLS